jgi:hypothetical protein
MRKKRTLTEEHKNKIGNAHRGKKKIFSPVAIENIRKAAAKRRGIPVGPCSELKREKIRIATKGKKKTIIAPNPSWFPKGHKPIQPFKKGHIPWNMGKPMSQETIERIAKINRLRGKCRYGSWNYIQWKKMILKRDNYKCQQCYSVDRLHVHHIKSWDTYPELRFDINNGITLCISCHARLHVIEGKYLRSKKGSNLGCIPWIKGKKHTEESRKKMSESHKDQIPWNKNKCLTVV